MKGYRICPNCSI